jgi:hypothetical protein
MYGMHRYRQTLLLVTPEKGVNNNAICSVCIEPYSFQ